MDEKHIIENAVFEIAFSCEEDALAQEGQLGRLMKHDLLPVVDDVLHEVSLTRGGVIEQLTVDLGEMEYTAFQEDMKDRLRVRLKAALEESLRLLPRPSVPDSEFKGQTPSDMAWLERALLSDRLFSTLENEPSTRTLENGASAKGRTIDERLASVLALSAPVFITFLKQSKQQEKILKRLIYQCEELTLGELVYRLTPSRSASLEGLLNSLKKYFRDHPFGTMTERAWRDLIWEELLTLLLSSDDVVFQTQALLDRIIKKGMNTGGEAEKQWVKNMRETLKGGAQAGRFFVRIDEKKGEWITVLRDALILVMMSGDPKPIYSIWRSILREQTPLLKTLVMDYGRLARVRRALSHGFPDPMLRDIVGVIEPAALGFIGEIVERPSLFKQLKQHQREEASQVKKRLWEFTLTYLIVERGSRFNKKAYLGSVVAQMAAHENMRYATLLSSLIAGLSKIEVPNAVKHEMLQLLAELSGGDAVKVAVETVPNTDTVGVGFTQAYDLYETLKDALFKKADIEDATELSISDLNGIIGELARLHPAQLLRLYRELQTDFSSNKNAAYALPEQVLARLIKGFLFLIPAEKAEPADLIEAIEAYALQVTQKQAYYQEVLASLIAGQVIDFEMILARERIPGQRPAILENGVGPRSDGAEKKEWGSADSDKILALRKQIIYAVIQGDPETLQPLWQQILHDHAVLLKEILVHHGREIAVRKKLSLYFPDPMLHDIVRIVEPGASVFIHAVVDGILKRPVLLQEAVGRSLEKTVETRGVVWEFTLAYLLADRGSHFNKKTYLGGLIGRMASHRNRRYHDFLFSLTQHLEQIEMVNVVKSEMLLILRDLSLELTPSKRPKGAVEDQGLQKKNRVPEAFLNRSYELYETVKEALLHGKMPQMGSGKEKDLVLHGIDTLLETQPWQLLRLFRELQSGGFSSDRIASGLSSKSLLLLIRAFLSLTPSASGGTDSSDLIEAISAWTKQAYPGKWSEYQKDLRFYYQEILLCLIHHQVIDFEVMMKRKIAGEAMDSRTESLKQKVRNPDHEAQTSKEKDSSMMKVRQNLAEAPSFSRPPKEVLPLLDQALSPLVLLKRVLQSRSPLTAAEEKAFSAAIQFLLVREPGRLSRFFSRALRDRRAAARLVSFLPESLLLRLLHLLRPEGFERLLRTADFIASAACVKEIALGSRRISRLKWAFIFQYAIEEGRRFYPEVFVRLFTEALSKEAYYADIAAFRALLRRQLELHLLPGIKNDVLALIEIFSEISNKGETEWVQGVPAEQDQRLGQPESESFDEKALESGEVIYVENAGMVIAAPYLERFFSLLHLTEKGAFKNREAAERAVHLLQFMVDTSTETPEVSLVLNKVLCGVKTGTPIVREIAITEEEKTVITGLIEGMIANWRQIGKTSVQGFRESFLQREGRLERRGEDWRLTVLPKAFDMLLDHIPWSFSMIKLPWMERMMYVKWR